MSIPDLVIRGGTVADGHGGELFEADVAITGGRIRRSARSQPRVPKRSMRAENS